MRKTFKKFVLAAFSMILAVAATAQVTTSSMSGRVSEANGTPVPGAAVVAVHTPSGSQYYAIADNAGNYRIQNMRVGGPYEVEVSILGFGKAKSGNITLRLGENYVHNVTLSEEAITLGEVVVTAGIPNPILNSDRTGASLNISSRELAALPSVSRSITDFTRLTPQANGSSFAGRDGRYNTITVDGAAFNNNFGLSSNLMPGGSAQPFSMDAIEEISVNVAPYDVRLSQFTGASINAVTKSGDNTYKATAYTFQRPGSFTGDKVGDITVPAAHDKTSQVYGFTAGGPIVKNKLFFFISAEYEKEQTPLSTWEPSTNGTADLTNRISRTTVSDLQLVKDYLLDTYDYDPGYYQGFSAFPSQNYKILGRIDWNIAKNHKMSFRYNRLENTNTVLTNATSGPSGVTRSNYSRIGEKSIAFSNAFYGEERSVNGFAGELNSTFGSKFANKLLVSYTAVKDPQRTSPSALFPFVDIYKDGDPYMSFGYELFTYKNQVLNNTLSVVDNLTINLDKHTLTAGISYDNIYVNNSYVREGTSYYRFASVSDFINNAKPIAFGVTYGYNGQPIKGVEMNFGLLSTYLQDEWQVSKKLKITYGIRAEQPLYLNNIKNNPAVDNLLFGDAWTTLNNPDAISYAYKLDLGTWPNSKLQINPRIGFNYDILGDRSLQLRGGTGIFSGLLPFVWFTNQPSSSGTIQSPEIGLTTTLPSDFRFDPDWMAQVGRYPSLFPQTMSSTLPSGSTLAAVDKNFKMPQVWRTNLAVDVELPFNMILTVEALYSKDLNAVMQKNINLPYPQAHYYGADDRPYWTTNKINSGLSSAMLLTNIDKGYQKSLTVQLTKNFSYGLSGMVAYTYNEAKDVTSNPGSAANSAWASNLDVWALNAPALSYSNFSIPHRVVGSLTYKINYFKHFATSFSVYYSGAAMGRYSYAFSNDMNGDGNASDLIYVPNSASEMIFVDKAASGIYSAMSASEQAAKFMEFIDGDPYLKSRKGQYTERFAKVAPWYNRWDAKVVQDIYHNFGTDRKYTLQVTLDVLNVGNLINSSWGNYSRHGLSNSYNVILPLKYISRDATTNTPKVQLNAGDIADFDAKNKEIKSVSTGSTWGAQLGFRFIF